MTSLALLPPTGDGTVEGHSTEEWEEILTACGMNAQQKAAWKDLRFF
jgi:hypothetical protein